MSALIERLRKRRDWWREMHGPNDLDEEHYDEAIAEIERLQTENEALRKHMDRQAEIAGL